MIKSIQLCFYNPNTDQWRWSAAFCGLLAHYLWNGTWNITVNAIQITLKESSLVIQFSFSSGGLIDAVGCKDLAAAGRERERMRDCKHYVFAWGQLQVKKLNNSYRATDTEVCVCSELSIYYKSVTSKLTVCSSSLLPFIFCFNENKELWFEAPQYKIKLW